MAYFSNGSEGMEFEESVCSACQREGDCPVWDMHMLYNDDGANNKDSLLHKMIPVDEDGFSRTCNFFKQFDPQV